MLGVVVRFLLSCLKYLGYCCVSIGSYGFLLGWCVNLYRGCKLIFSSVVSVLNSNYLEFSIILFKIKEMDLIYIWKDRSVYKVKLWS